MMVRWWLESCVKRVSSQTSSYLTLSNQYISRQCTHYSCPWIAAKWLVLCQDACRSLKQIYSEYYPTLHRCLLKHMHYIRLGCWVSKVNLGTSSSQPIALHAIMIMTTMFSIIDHHDHHHQVPTGRWWQPGLVCLWGTPSCSPGSLSTSNNTFEIIRLWTSIQEHHLNANYTIKNLIKIWSFVWPTYDCLTLSDLSGLQSSFLFSSLPRNQRSPVTSRGKPSGSFN